MSLHRVINLFGRSARGLGMSLLLSASGVALAQETVAAPSAEIAAPAHQLSLYGTAGGTVYLSPTRTAGGLGAGLGVRDIINGRFLLQADLSYLTLVGTAGELRLGAGVQRSGVYTPALLVTVSALFGDRLTFLTPEHPVAWYGPAVTVGLTVAPARFTVGGTQVSLLEVGVGLAPELPGLGVAYRLRLIEVGASF